MLAQGWKLTMLNVEYAPGRGRQDLLHLHHLLPGAGLPGQLAGWKPHGAGLDFTAKLCPLLQATSSG